MIFGSAPAKIINTQHLTQHRVGESVMKDVLSSSPHLQKEIWNRMRRERPGHGGGYNKRDLQKFFQGLYKENRIRKDKLFEAAEAFGLNKNSVRTSLVSPNRVDPQMQTTGLQKPAVKSDISLQQRLSMLQSNRYDTLNHALRAGIAHEAKVDKISGD